MGSCSFVMFPAQLLLPALIVEARSGCTSEVNATLPLLSILPGNAACVCQPHQNSSALCLPQIFTTRVGLLF